MSDSYMCQQALKLASFGLSVIALVPRKKSPPFKGWPQWGTNDPEQIRRYWSPERILLQEYTDEKTNEPKRVYSNPDYNIGLITGRQPDGSYVVVVDCDEKPGKLCKGVTLANEWQKDHGPFPKTWKARTGSGGEHYFFKTPENKSMDREQRLGPNSDVDFQSSEALIVLPPSMHPNGRPYEWIFAPWDGPVAEMDSNVAGFLIDLMKYRKASDSGDGAMAANTVPGPDEKYLDGHRHNSLLSLGRSMYTKGMDLDLIVSVLWEINLRHATDPLSRKEFDSEVVPGINRYEGQESKNPFYNTWHLQESLRGTARHNEIVRAYMHLRGKGFSENAVQALLAMENERICNPPLAAEALEKAFNIGEEKIKKGGPRNVRRPIRYREV